MKNDDIFVETFFVVGTKFSPGMRCESGCIKLPVISHESFIFCSFCLLRNLTDVA